MTLALESETKNKVLEVHVSGKLTTEDYHDFLPRVEELIAEHSKIRILFEMHEFHGWTAGAVWEDIKFDAKHFAHIERLALVGEKKWEQGMATFCKPFTSAKIKYFDRAKMDDARHWLAEE